MAQKLKVNAKPTFTAPVVWRLSGDNGEIIEIPFSATFRRVSGDEAKDMQAQMDARTLLDTALLDKVLVGWDKLLDEDGMPYVFTPENRASARADWSTFEAALVLSYFKHHDAAAVKNF